MKSGVCTCTCHVYNYVCSRNVSTNVSMCVAGKVYNVTEFMKYHPGGKAQLMRGAGIDCTELFAKVHMHICTYTCMHVHMYSFLILQIFAVYEICKQK